MNTFRSNKQFFLSLFLLILAMVFVLFGSIDRLSSTTNPNAKVTEAKATMCEQLEDAGEEEKGAGCEDFETARHHQLHPIPIVGHILGGTLLMFSAIITLNSNFLKRSKTLHRACGYVFIFGGIIAGISAVWMTYSFPARFNELNIVTNYIWGGALIVCPIIAFAYIAKRDIQNHRAWMIRAYCFAAGPAVHRLLFFTYIGPFGGEYGHYWDFVLSLLTLVVGEAIIRTQRKTFNS